MLLYIRAKALDGRSNMKNTITIARAHPDLSLSEAHKLTTDQQNLIELTCAAHVVVSHLDTVAVPPVMREACERLRKAIRPVDINPNAKKS